MNIFKVLANGYGNISETNVSSFLAYLLDPKADHGLRYEFLKKFTSSVLAEEIFLLEKYEYEIFLEQSFREAQQARHKVDIVIVCYSYDNGKLNESYVKEFLNSKKQVHKIFLIENKTNKGSLTHGQLIGQLNSVKAELEDDLHEKIYSIFITPKNSKIIEEFANSNLKKGSHIYWKSLEKMCIRDSLNICLTNAQKLY